MNKSTKPATIGETGASWEQRLLTHPELLPQIAALLDIIELKRADTATADQAETGVRATVQQLGQNMLSAWALQRQAQVVAHCQAVRPAAQHHTKKLSWHTTFGAVALTEERRPLGRRGAVQRPFCEQAQIQAHGYSRPPQAAQETHPQNPARLRA